MTTDEMLDTLDSFDFDDNYDLEDDIEYDGEFAICRECSDPIDYCQGHGRIG